MLRHLMIDDMLVVDAYAALILLLLLRCLFMLLLMLAAAMLAFYAMLITPLFRLSPYDACRHCRWFSPPFIRRFIFNIFFAFAPPLLPPAATSLHRFRHYATIFRIIAATYIRSLRHTTASDTL